MQVGKLSFRGNQVHRKNYLNSKIFAFITIGHCQIQNTHLNLKVVFIPEVCSLRVVFLILALMLVDVMGEETTFGTSEVAEAVASKDAKSEEVVVSPVEVATKANFEKEKKI